MLDVKNLLGGADLNSLVGQMLGGMATKNFAAGLLAGGVGTSLLGGGKDTVETVAKVGGLALLGTLAYKAYGNYQQQKMAGGTASVGSAVSQSAQGMFAQASGLLSGLIANAQPQIAEAIPAPYNNNLGQNNLVQNNLAQNNVAPINNELPLSIIRAMIGAAKADGNMDTAEIQKIMGQLDTAGIGAQEKMLLMQEMANTPDVNTIANGAKTPQDSAQIYLAALLVCDSQCASEQQYLLTLSNALSLDPSFTASLQQEMLKMSAQNAA